MGTGVSSILIGTSGLTVATVVALTLTISRSGVAAEQVSRLRWISSLLVLLQVAHVAEEYLLHFHLRFPGLLGLPPWPGEFLVAFNVAWLAIWGAAIAGVTKLPRIAAFPLWFLAIASAANGIVHPLLALADGGYFPGLWTSPFVGILGVLLLRSLASATTAESTA